MGDEVGTEREFWEKGWVKGGKFGEIWRCCCDRREGRFSGAEEFIRSRNGGHVCFLIIYWECGKFGGIVVAKF